MNRRAFLTTAGTAAAAYTTGAFSSPVRLHAQSTTPSPNADIYSGSCAAHSIATGNAFCTAASPADWYSIANSLQAVTNDWQANNLDSYLAYAQLHPGLVTPDNLNRSQITQNIQIFQPAFTSDDLNALLTPYYNLPPDMVAGVISTLQQQGLTPYLQASINNANTMIKALTPSGSGGEPTAQYRGSLANPHPNVLQRPQLPPPEGGGGGYNCQTDDLAMLAVGTAFLVLGIMSGGVAPGLVVITASFWAPVAAWGGAATGAWAIGHGIFC